MLESIKTFLAKRGAAEDYRQALQRFLSDGKLDEIHEKHLEQLASQAGLDKSELRRIHQEATSAFFSQLLTADGLTEEVKTGLETLMQRFNLHAVESDFSKETFNRHYWLALVDKGILPTLDSSSVGITLARKETLHWITFASLKKWARKGDPVSFGGALGTVRVMRGQKYQLGTLKSTPIVEEVLADEDGGKFWLTNRRLGFHGRKKTFTIPLNKVVSFDLFHDGMAIRKEGRESPLIVGLVNMEFSAAVLSSLMNP
jgi:hypothetical protein